MPANAPLDGAALVKLSGDFNNLGNQTRGILNDPTIVLSPGESGALSADLTNLSNIAANLATWSARVVFSESDQAFKTISAATDEANAKVDQIKAIAGKISSVVSILGDAVSLGVAFGSGNPIGIITAANQLRNDAVSA
jgi:hypothetical protein